MLTPRAALAVLPDNAALLNAAGLAAGEAAWFRRAIAIEPDQPEPWANLAAALLSPEPARAALALAPDNAEAWNNLGTIRGEERDFRRARLLKPDFADACVNESGLRNDRGAAGTLARLAAALAPGMAEAWNNLANGLLLDCRLEEADAAFLRARTLAPGDAQIRFNHAAVLLKQGRMAEGWEAYEARRFTPAALVRRRALEPSAWPDWPGGDPAGKTLLLSTEQGYGDAIQFCRFASWMAGQGARVYLRTNAPLVRLLRSLPGVAEVLSFEEEPPPFDFHLPVMSLPRLHGEMAVPQPYLFADPGPWKERVAELPGRKIGLVWAGNPRPGQRAANLLDARRSLKASDFADLAAIDGVTLVSLQKDARPEGLDIVDWTGELTDFADTAALVQALDLVVSVDTSVAHLAGALGKPVCILSRFDGCWRWLQDRDLTPWYSSAYLFRQTRPGHWREPLAALYKHIVTV